jgi:hypothetical protein
LLNLLTVIDSFLEQKFFLDLVNIKKITAFLNISFFEKNLSILPGNKQACCIACRRRPYRQTHRPTGRPTGKTNPFSKIAVTLEPVMQF